MDNYIYFFSNKWTQYKIKCLDKKIPILKGRFKIYEIINYHISNLFPKMNYLKNNEKLDKITLFNP